VIDKLGKPEVTTFKEVYRAAAFSEIKTAQAAGTSNSFSVWLEDKKNRKAFTYRMEDCGYAPVRSPDSQQGLWQVVGERMVVYGKAELSLARAAEGGRRLDPGAGGQSQDPGQSRGCAQSEGSKS
jgi:hypothetical protein